MKPIQLRFATTSLLLTSLIAANTYAHDLVLKVDQIKQVKGTMMVALYNSESNYKSNNNTFSGQKIAVTTNTLTVNFGDVPEGEYAIKLYQDENDNGQIDKNLIGIPTEGYGFSNNGGSMGQPSFDDAKFKVSGTTKIDIHLH